LGLQTNWNDIDVKTNVGHTPLWSAAQENAPAVASFLIDRGADIQAKDNAGQTPIYADAAHKSLELARLLIDGGANTENSDLSWMD
jgi:ankyrin repeat protein